MYERQAGITLIGGVLVLVIAGVLVLAAARIVPAYLEAGEIGSVMNSMRKDAETKPVYQLRDELVNRLQMNSLGEVPLSDFEFSSHGDELTLSVDHSIQKSFIGNLGFVVHYRHQITVTRNSGND